MAFPDGWGRKCKIIIPAAKIAGNHVNFPLLLTGDNLPAEMLDGGANSALNGGGDIRFSEDAAGLSPLAAEIATLVTGALPAVEIWLKLPTLNAGAAKEFYVWYGKAGESQPLVTNPYGRNAVWADYELVSHDLTADSAGNHALTAFGAPTFGAPDPLGRSDAVTFNGTSDYIRATVNYAGSQAPLWLQTWARSATVGAFAGVVGLFSAASADRWQSLHQQFDQIGAITRVGGNMTTANTASPTAVLTSAWHLFHGVWATASDRRAYMDGGVKGTAITGFSFADTLDRLTIGRFDDSSPGSYFTGDLYGVRVRLSAPSDDWIATEYTNQSDPATFASPGLPESVAGGAALVIQAAAQGLTSASAGLAQFQDLMIPDAGQGHVADSPALTQAQTLTAARAVHALTGPGSTLDHLQDLFPQNGVCGLGNGAVSIFESSPYAPAARRTDRPTRADRIIYPNSSRTLRI